MATKKDLEKLKLSLERVKTDGRSPTVFVGGGPDDPDLILSAEDGGYFADYYGEYRGGYPWIDPRVEQWAVDNGMHLEWQNPGAVGIWYD
jgi:hypothetical protein